MNWRVYIVAHNAIHDFMYKNDPCFNNNNYVILNVGSLEKLENDEKYSVVSQRMLNNYKELGKFYTESEGIYNIWRSGVYKDLDFIGFIHYDKELRLIRKNIFGHQSTDITSRIEKYLRGKTKAHISFETHNVIKDYGQRILADVEKPNKFTGDGFNCYDYILNDYNAYFGKNYSKGDLFKKKQINLCSCFMIDVKTYEKMMGFWDYVVSSGKLNAFDTEHKNRVQGNLAERYFGVFMDFEYKKSKNLSLIHHYNRGLK